MNRTSKSFINHSSLSDHYIILDLDETLVHSFECSDSDPETKYNAKYIQSQPPEIRERIYSIPESEMGGDPNDHRITVWGIFRPGAEKFLLFCCCYFKKVIIWSAGAKEYVHAIVKRLTKNIKVPITILSKGDCYKSKSEDGFYSKPINSIAREFGINIEHTFICDDRDTAFFYNKDNGIEVPPYNPSPRGLSEQDRCLENLQNWFWRGDVSNSPDIRHLEKPGKMYLMSKNKIEIK